MRPIARPAAALLALALLPLPALADAASLHRLGEALTAIRAAPKKLLAVLPQLQRLDGVRVDARDAPSARAALGAWGPTLAPALDRLRALTVQDGQVRLLLSSPVVLELEDATLLLAEEATFTLRPGSDGLGALEDVRGIRVRAMGATVQVERIEVAVEGERRVARVEVRLGFLQKTLRFDQGPLAGGLAGHVAR